MQSIKQAINQSIKQYVCRTYVLLCTFVHNISFFCKRNFGKCHFISGIGQNYKILGKRGQNSELSRRGGAGRRRQCVYLAES